MWGAAALGMTALGGFAYWTLAALTSADPADVGRAAAWFTLTQLTVMACAVGAPILIHRSAGAPSVREIVGATTSIVIVASLVVGAAAPTVAGSAWAELSGVAGMGLSGLFAVLVAAASLTLIVDARLVSLRAWRAVFVRAAVPAVVKLPLLALDPMEDRATWLVLVAVAPVSASGLIGWFVLWRRSAVALVGPLALGPDDRRFLLGQHLGVLATQAPFHVIPLIVAGRVAGQTNAAFYLVWSVGVMLTMLPQTLTQVLLSEVSLEQSNRLVRIRRTLAANMTIGLCAWLAATLLGPTTLSLIGPSYAELAPVLPWLVAAAIVFGVTSICLTEARLARDSVLTNAITWTIALGSLGVALALVPSRPVWGSVYAWVGANVAAMVVAMVGVERRVLVSPTGRAAA